MNFCRNVDPKHLRLACLLGMAATLGGCASIESFSKMSPEERANFVCVRTPDYKELSYSLDEVEDNLHDSQIALRQGYRLVEKCSTVYTREVVGEVCTPLPGGGTSCTLKREPRSESVCEDHPVAIDGELEERKVELYSERALILSEQLGEIYGSCYTSVVGMSAEQAFNYYKAGGGF